MTPRRHRVVKATAVATFAALTLAACSLLGPSPSESMRADILEAVPGLVDVNVSSWTDSEGFAGYDAVVSLSMERDDTITPKELGSVLKAAAPHLGSYNGLQLYAGYADGDREIVSLEPAYSALGFEGYGEGRDRYSLRVTQDRIYSVLRVQR